MICQFQAGGVDHWKVAIVQALIAETGCANVFERADALVRKGEGMPVVSGALAGEAPPARVVVLDGKDRFDVDLKTGFVYPR